jgi:uncharacterized protein YcnI
VTPPEASPGAVQRYCIRVPSEKSIATTAVEVQFPDSIEVTELESPAGWQAAAQKDRRSRTASALWQGGSIPPRQFLEFGVVARNPAAEMDLAWKAIQTYADGSEVHWIGPPRAQFPAAITSVRASATQKADACSSGPAPLH